MFYVTGGVLFVGWCAYTFGVPVEEQEWAKEEKNNADFLPVVAMENGLKPTVTEKEGLHKKTDGNFEHNSDQNKPSVTKL